MRGDRMPTCSSVDRISQCARARAGVRTRVCAWGLVRSRAWAGPKDLCMLWCARAYSLALCAVRCCAVRVRARTHVSVRMRARACT